MRFRHSAVRYLLPTFALLVASVTIAQPVWAQQARPQGNRLTPATAASIDSLVRAFDRAWEPQHSSAQQNAEQLDRLFVSDSSFLWITDGFYTKDRERWMEANRRSLATRALRSDSIVHRAIWSDARQVGENTVLHNSAYCAEGWRKDGSKSITVGASTMLFVRKSHGWQISVYHGYVLRGAQPLTACPTLPTPTSE
jgi:hypothetical protein